ncbi:hypothetical protein LX64_04879 [Chitinophaga skermanii]|uniref:Uncharacterized protein n=1 Tax=Chitinophaga skermanii TaxID=331697 RepID=A0A327Q423_9BACT|nr:hypothetical protein [Chitinophaga skermanii]RAI98517.1 hypothetical protein LX64_04879 [Chitinophaga skermanii]
MLRLIPVLILCFSCNPNTQILHHKWQGYIIIDTIQGRKSTTTKDDWLGHMPIYYIGTKKDTITLMNDRELVKAQMHAMYPLLDNCQPFDSSNLKVLVDTSTHTYIDRVYYGHDRNVHEGLGKIDSIIAYPAMFIFLENRSDQPIFLGVSTSLQHVGIIMKSDQRTWVPTHSRLDICCATNMPYQIIPPHQILIAKTPIDHTLQGNSLTICFKRFKSAAFSNIFTW